MSYDPTYAHEVAVIIQDGLRRMFTEQEDVFYYITLMNENYEHPGLPRRDDRRDEVVEGIKRGMYLLRSHRGRRADGPRVQLLGSGTILREVEAAAELLAAEYGRGRRHLELPSFTELAPRRPATSSGGTCCTPAEPRRISWVDERLAERPAGPVVAATDYMRAFADQIRAVRARRPPLRRARHGRLRPLGLPRNLRRHFEVDRHHVAVAALSALAAEGAVPATRPTEAIARYGIDPDKPDPARA